MGEDEKYVFNVGCPRIDLIRQELINNNHEVIKDLFKNYGSVGREFDLSSSYLLVSQHSVTTEYNDSRNQIEETLSALEEINLPTIMLWPMQMLAAMT